MVLMHEAIIRIIIFVLLALDSFSFTAANANGKLNFGKIFSKDLATYADVVNSGYGDVMHRYDNHKPTIKQ